MGNPKENKKRLLTPVIMGILIATFLLIISLRLGGYYGNRDLYYMILVMIGPAILIALITNSALIYSFVLFIYFICLSVILWMSNKKYKKLILGMLLLLHLLSVIMFKYKIDYDFKFLQQIDWRSVMQEWSAHSNLGNKKQVGNKWGHCL